jgi:hypothetical protein
MKLAQPAVGDKLLWRHRRASELREQATCSEQLQRTITVKAIFTDYIKTDFGDYFCSNGLSVHTACGCKRFCDCWGEVERLESS